jgi:hypothetical protein
MVLATGSSAKAFNERKANKDRQRKFTLAFISTHPEMI